MSKKRPPVNYTRGGGYECPTCRARYAITRTDATKGRCDACGQRVTLPKPNA